MSVQLPNLGLYGEIQECEDGILDKINQNFKTLDGIVQLGFSNFVADQASLPSTGNVSGDTYIAEDDGTIYIFTDQWEPYTPNVGFLAYDISTDILYVYTPTGWEPVVDQDDLIDKIATEYTGTAPGTVGQLVYNNAGTWELADHTDVDKVAIAMISAIDTVNGTWELQTSGKVRWPSHGLTVGSYYFGDKATLGGATDVDPAVASLVGDVRKSVFHVTDDDHVELLLQNEPIVFEESASPAYNILPAALYRSSSGQTIAQASNQEIQFNEEIVTSPDITPNVTNSVFTINKLGLYDIKAVATLANVNNLGVTTQMEIQIWINGANTFSSLDANSVSSGTLSQNGNQSCQVSGMLRLDVGDTIQIIARHNNTNNLNRPLITGSVFNYVNITRMPEETIL